MVGPMQDRSFWRLAMLCAAVSTTSLFILWATSSAYAAPDDPAAPNLAPATPPVSTGLPAVPDAGAQEQANKLLRQLFGAEIDAARTPQAKVELARKLLQQGIDSRDDPAGRYVLLTKAKELAIAVGDPALAMQAVDEITRSFRIDGTALSVEALTALSKLSLNPNLSKALAEATAAALDGAIAADKFEAAKPLVTIGVAASKKTKDAELIRQWLARGKDLDELQAAYEAVKDAIAKLDAKPLDAAANTAVGRYRILSKGDWDGGIPMLASATTRPCKPWRPENSPILIPPMTNSSWPTAGGNSPRRRMPRRRTASRLGPCSGTTNPCRA